MHLIYGLFEQRTIALAILAFGTVAGIAIPAVAELLQPYALQALFLVVVFSMVPFARLPSTNIGLDVSLVWRLILWQQAFLPCLVVAVGILLQLSDSILTLMMATACAGSLFASPMLAELLGLDRRRAVQCMVISTFVMPVSLYVSLRLLHGQELPLDVAEYCKRVVVFLLLPLSILTIYGRIAASLSSAVANRIESTTRWGAVLALLVFVMGMTHPVSQLLAEDPLRLCLLLALTTCLTIGMFAITAIVMYRFGLPIALTAGILSGFRNIGLAFAFVGPSLGPEFAAYVGVSMLPMFIAPLLIRLAALRQAQDPRPSPSQGTAAVVSA
jgi:bile acid:Na+ symporter, BASS family